MGKLKRVPAMSVCLQVLRSRNMALVGNTYICMRVVCETAGQ